MMAFYTVPQLVSGPGALQQLSGLGARRAYVIADPEIVRRGTHRRVVEELEKGGATVEVGSEVAVEPSWDSLRPAAERLRAFRPDWVVALGGGSTIDTAKGSWLRASAPEVTPRGLTPLVELDLRAFARFVALPTTTGSGAEASWTGCFTEAGEVVEVAHRALIPDWAVLEPALAATQSKELVARSGAGAFARAVEAFLGPWASPFTDAAAREALGTLWRLALRLTRDPTDLELIAPVQAAATLSGMASANSQLGLAHAIGDLLGPPTGRPRSLVVAAALPPVLEYLYPVVRERLPLLGEWADRGAGQQRGALAGQVREFFDRLGLPRHLGGPASSPGAGALDPAALAPRLLRAPAALASPRLPTLEEGRQLLAAVLTGAPSPA